MYREQEKKQKETKSFLNNDYWKTMGLMQEISKFAKPESNYFYD
jgi:hypothetical protein